MTAVFIERPNGFVGYIEELPETNTRGATFEEVREDLRGAVRRVSGAGRGLPARGGTITEGL